MDIRKIDFMERHMMYFTIIPAFISISLALIFYRYLSVPILHLRAIEFIMPWSIDKACSKEEDGLIHFFRASDMYGHLNLIIGKEHKVLYHTIYKPIDWNARHHLDPDRIQINIGIDAFKACDIDEIGSVILNEQKKHLAPEHKQEQKGEFIEMPQIDGSGPPIKLYLIDDKNKNDDKNEGQEFNVTFSSIDGAKYEDFVKILDAMLKYNVKLYSPRDLTSSEAKAIKDLGY